MADVKSKNLYELLGNDHDEDSDKEPEPPVKVVDKPVARTSKRNAAETIPERGSGGERGGRGGRRGGFSGNEGAFRDRDVGSNSNRGKPVDDGIREDRHSHRGGGRGYDRGGRGRGGGGRGREYKDSRDDRHSHGRANDHVKQTDQSWGAPTGGSEWDDEKAGEAIAQDEAKQGFDTNVDPPIDAEGNRPEGETAPAAQQEPEPEPEDTSKSYADYLAEQAEKKLSFGIHEARKPNEGSKLDKKWAQAKPLAKDEEEDEYISGKGGKAGRQRERKEKNTLEIDHRFVEPNRGERGGRGRGRGDFRGGDRGGRGDFRGVDRGGRGRGRGGDFRGGRGEGRGGRGRGDAVNVSDTSAFPSLGGS